MSLLNRFRIGTKINGIVLIMLLFSGLIAVLGLVYLSQGNARLTHVVDVSAEKVRLSARLHADLLQIALAEKNLLLSTDAGQREEYTAATEPVLADMQDLETRLQALVDDRGKSLLTQYHQALTEYLALGQQVRDLAAAGDTAGATALSQGETRTKLDAAASNLLALVAKNDADMETDQAVSAAAFVRARALMIGVSALLVVVGLMMGMAVSRSITVGLKGIVRVAADIAEGDVAQAVTVDSQDEIGELAQAFNRSIDYLRDMAGVADRVAKGDLAVQVAPRSLRDTLGQALRTMVAELNRVTAENRRRIWLATGQAGLSDQIRGDLDTATLAHNIITYLCHYLDAQIGAVYVHQDDALKLVGSYAYTHRKGLSDQFKLGEGLVGQAALEQQPIVISDVPDDYVRIQSGLGQSPPRHLLVIPYVHDGQVNGVIELGRFAEWTDAQVEFLHSVTENVAIAYQMVDARRRTLELLQETQRQAEELQIQTEELETQQEELRQTNEELEEQTQSLKASEEELQAQQAELEATNEELTEKTHLLEQQRAAVEEQNRELETAREGLELRAQQLALTSRYKSEFLSNMSHELRTPLNSMLILARMLAENQQDNLNPDQVESAQVICDSGHDLLVLINDILDLAKVESGHMERRMEEFSLAEWLDETARSFAPMARDKGLDFRTHLDESLPTNIHSDRKRLGQIVKNLLSNAFKFTQEGQVTLRISRPDSGDVVGHDGLDLAKTIAFSVTDTGIGISEEHQLAIFEAFQQVDGSISREYGGTGLGLSISRELAAFLGGEIAVKSIAEQGSTFTLYLPETPPAESSLENLPAVAQAPRLSATMPAPISIPDDRDDLADGDRVLLIIEDDDRFAAIVRDLARERGFKVLVASTGEVGLELARTHHPTAVLLDLKLPAMSGWDVLALLKEDPDTRHIPVHIMSAEEETLDAFRRGAIGYLAKPAELADLDRSFGLIEKHLDRSIRTLLIVEDDKGTRLGMRKLIGNGDVQCLEAATAKEALTLLQSQPVDCMILDLRLPDMSGFELLDLLEADETLHKPPVIVYTGKELTQEENEQLIRYADTVIVKGIKSEERLLDETALFLHRVVADLPQGKQRIIRQLHDQDSGIAGKKILLVDDDVRNAFSLSRLLTQKGLIVEIATDGQKALDTLAAQPDIDLVLMDVMLPVMDGLEVTRRIREQRRFANLPILAITAKAMKGDRDKCLAAGANDYLSKPVDVDRLLSLLRVWLYR